MKKPDVRKIFKYVGRGALCTLTVLVALLIAAYSVMFVLAKGPSPTASTLFVRSVMETSAAKFLARIYFTEEEIAAILSAGDGDDVITDPSLIQIPSDTKPSGDTETDPVGTDTDEPGTADVTDNPETSGGDTSEASTEAETDAPDEDEGIEVISVRGDTYNGTLLIVHDPSRVSLGTLPEYGEGYSGKTLRKFIEDAGAIGGINAGGFEDDGGNGTGAVPDGIVIRDGEIIWGNASTKYKCVMGFDKDHILHVGNMTGKQALDAGIVDGLNFSLGPVLVVNGAPQNSKKSLGGGLNPRTAIGQRADGAVLLLVINGRQADSLGATYDDLVSIMLGYGAVNAANLDGGSSTLMMYKGETMNQSAYFFGERKLPNVFLVEAAE